MEFDAAEWGLSGAGYGPLTERTERYIVAQKRRDTAIYAAKRLTNAKENGRG